MSKLDSSRIFSPLPETPGPGRGERAYLLLAGIFLGALVLTNLIAGKFWDFFGLPLSCGVIAYPMTFLATDLVSEVYGRRRATQIVKVGFVVSLFVTAIVWLANKAPIAPESYVDEASFRRVFGLTPGIVFGSMIAYLTAQFVDVVVFEFWRNLTGGRHLWLRNNGSTILSQLLDTVMVVTIALIVWPVIDGDPETHPITRTTWWQIIVGQYLFKAGVALADTPFFYLGTRWLHAWIAQDAAAAPGPGDRVGMPVGRRAPQVFAPGVPELGAAAATRSSESMADVSAATLEDVERGTGQRGNDPEHEGRAR